MYNPAKYDSSNQEQRCMISELVEEFGDEFMTMSGQCIDIGCGPGGITKDILMPALPPNTTILGADISADMVSHAKKIHADNERLKFDTLDIQTKNLPEKYLAEFHHIFSFQTLHWCADTGFILNVVAKIDGLIIFIDVHEKVRLAFNNIYHMLRPGGSMFVLLIMPHDIFNVFNLLTNEDRYASYIPTFSSLCLSPNPRKELKTLLTNIGFKVHHCSHRQVVSLNENQCKSLASIMSCTLLPHEMPEKLVTQFWKDVECEYMKKKICYEEVKNNSRQTIIIDLFKTIIVYASK